MTDASGGLETIEHTVDGYDEIVLDLGDVRGDASITTDEEPLPASEAWDEFATLVYCHALEPARQEVGRAMGHLADAIRDETRPTAEQVREARRALDNARALVEDHYADLAVGVEPWGEGAGSTTPYGVFQEQLERHGYDVTRPGER